MAAIKPSNKLDEFYWIRRRNQNVKPLYGRWIDVNVDDGVDWSVVNVVVVPQWLELFENDSIVETVV